MSESFILLDAETKFFSRKSAAFQLRSVERRNLFQRLRRESQIQNSRPNSLHFHHRSGNLRSAREEELLPADRMDLRKQINRFLSLLRVNVNISQPSVANWSREKSSDAFLTDDHSSVRQCRCRRGWSRDNLSV